MPNPQLNPDNLPRLLAFLVTRLTPADFAHVERLLCAAAAWQRADQEEAVLQ